MAIIAQDTTTGRASEGGHWYSQDGNPCYEIRAKGNGLMRPVTLRDARPLGLVPGVSTIAGMEAKPALVKWMVEQALMSALTLPRIPNEAEEAFMARAREDSQQQAKKAAERGTQIHAALQGHFEGAPTAADDIPYVMPVVAWLKQRYGEPALPYEAEHSFAHPLGFGGKSDLINRSIPLVADFKVKDFDEKKQAKDLAYPEHASQLAAYRDGFRLPKAQCINIFVSSRVPGLIRVREWDEAEVVDAWECFRCLLRLWQLRKGYNSAFSLEQAA
ncbi:MAG: hypothetical protein JWN63_3436 [Candidatus Acidoferrum typicum]|nr:hypothetical protein [Candidatus Acidoferrum typicum]